MFTVSSCLPNLQCLHTCQVTTTLSPFMLIDTHACHIQPIILSPFMFVPLSCWFGHSCLPFRSCFTYMYAVACSWLSPLLACHTLRTPHLTQVCTVIAYLPCLLAAPLLLNTHFMHLVYPPPSLLAFRLPLMHAFS